MRILLLTLCLSFLPLARAEVNIEKHDLQVEYGLAYHTLRGRQEENETKGRLTSAQYPYWLAAYTIRLTQNSAFRLFGGVQFVQFDEPAFGTTLSEKQALVQYGGEFVRKLGPIMKLGIFGMKQDHPLYVTTNPDEYEVIRASFAQLGTHISFSQRRRIGFLWGIGVKGYALFPTKGGDFLTEMGGGGEGYLRLGWVGPLGTIYHLKGFYQVSTAPNADVTFTHEILGYSLNVQYSF
ncbi:MAG: hypothetical protein V4598_09725 [Bdellovibrionota bacterium]